ncbi:MAG: hypothetical protein AVDCRST_MAG77-5945 [uncultured Chloroflexi bacterium]|uniref:Uncharacterized protein n=1 Tax=uncultured Chloroflexota bacterium TaxID=166587 RepID=A0A6J4KAV4_9CHLR|nr:MAG: hypothetical protein AVDCRST_MAG77-5945 [uncultured Chloroflexota bacterium]
MSNTAAPPANAAISIRTTLANSKWLGKPSPKSGKEIALGDQVVLCPKCYTPHLLADWRENDNKCAVDGTPARVIERAARATGDAAPAAAAAAPATSAAPAAAAAPARPAAAAAAPAAAGSAPAVQAASVVVDPYRFARVVEATPVSEVWRRNIMTVFWILVIWAVFVTIIYLAELGPGARI